MDDSMRRAPSEPGHSCPPAAQGTTLCAIAASRFEGLGMALWTRQSPYSSLIQAQSYQTPLSSIRNELSVRALFEDDVRTLPRFVIDQAPFVPRTGVVLCQKHVTRTEGKGLSADRCKFQHAGQRDDVLRSWGIVPIKTRMRRSLFELDRFRIHQLGAIYTSRHYVRVPIRPGV